jgi:hypothetical protein
VHLDSLGAARAWIVERFTEWAGSLSRGERAAIVAYKGTGYAQINEALRGEVVEDDEGDIDVDEAVDRLDEALARYALPEAVIVYRGVVSDELAAIFDTLAEGQTIEDDGYWSTSLLRLVAEKFLAEGGDDDDDEIKFVMEITLPAGAHAIYAGAPDLLHDLNEAEILLPRGSRFAIRATRDADDITRFRTIEMEALP